MNVDRGMHAVRGAAAGCVPDTPVTDLHVGVSQALAQNAEDVGGSLCAQGGGCFELLGLELHS